MTRAEIKWRLRIGLLIRVHPGVYRVGHRAPSVEARYMAAVRACGPGAALCDVAAAHLWGLVRGAAPAPAVVALTNRREGAHHVDCRWPEHHVTVELDSYRCASTVLAELRDLLHCDSDFFR